MCIQELFRSHTDADQKLKQDYDARRRQTEMEDRVTQGLVQAEREREQDLRRVRLIIDYHYTVVPLT